MATLLTHCVAEHDLLKEAEGIWDAHFEKFMEGRREPYITEGVNYNRLLPGGLWVTMKQQYEFPGGTFEGRAVYGYDPRARKYVGLWIDSTNPHLNISEGDYDPDTRTLTLIADGVDPTTGERTKVKQVKVFEEPGVMVFSVYRAVGGGDERLLLRVTARRRKRGTRGKIDNEGSCTHALADAEPFTVKRAEAGFHHDWESAKPTAHHNILRRYMGTWDADVASYRGGPTVPARLFKAIEENSLVGQGLWLAREIRTDTSEGDFEGYGFLGYDPEQRAYVGAWVDSTNPYRVIWRGSFNEDSQTLTLVANVIDPATGNVTREREDVIMRPDGAKETVLYRVADDGRLVKLMDAVCKCR